VKLSIPLQLPPHPHPGEKTTRNVFYTVEDFEQLVFGELNRFVAKNVFNVKLHKKLCFALLSRLVNLI
jgi:hypothetical protein